MNVIFPVYWETADLPTYMSMLNYVDCRERSETLLGEACDELVRSIKPTGA